MDEVCGVWTGFPRPGLCCGGCQCFEIAQLSQIKVFRKAFIENIPFPLRHRTSFCICRVHSFCSNKLNTEYSLQCGIPSIRVAGWSVWYSGAAEGLITFLPATQQTIAQLMLFIKRSAVRPPAPQCRSQPQWKPPGESGNILATLLEIGFLTPLHRITVLWRQSSRNHHNMHQTLQCI